MYENGPNVSMGLGNFTDIGKEYRQHEIFIDILAAVKHELKRATDNYGPMNTEHEAYAIILEEIDELWDEIKKKPSVRSKEKMAEEAIQCMAMLARFIIDCKLPVNKVK